MIPLFIAEGAPGELRVTLPERLNLHRDFPTSQEYEGQFLGGVTMRNGSERHTPTVLSFFPAMDGVYGEVAIVLFGLRVYAQILDVAEEHLFNDRTIEITPAEWERIKDLIATHNGDWTQYTSR